MKISRPWLARLGITAALLGALVIYQNRPTRAVNDSVSPRITVLPDSAASIGEDHSIPHRVERPAMTGEPAVMSIAGLVLRGTLATGDPGTDSALIGTIDGAGVARYRIGDTLPGGGMLAAIRSRSVDVRTSAGLETLGLDFAGFSPVSAAQPRSSSIRDASLAAAMTEVPAGGDTPKAATSGDQAPNAPTSAAQAHQAAARERALAD